LNEEKGIRETISSIPVRKLEKMGYEPEILIVDSLSTDRTVEMAKEEGARAVIEKRLGYGRAYKTGFGNAEGDIMVTLDADGTYPSKDIAELIRALKEEDLDFITTNRFARMEKGSMSFRNRFGNGVLSVSARLLFGLPFRDSQSGMWVIRRSAWEKVKDKVKSDSMAFSQEIKIEMHRAGLRCKEVGIGYSVRKGDVKLNAWKDGIGNMMSLMRKRIKG
jgi:glycosyltransferase involved in cell wall biosynthesis